MEMKGMEPYICNQKKPQDQVKKKIKKTFKPRILEEWEINDLIIKYSWYQDKSVKSANYYECTYSKITGCHARYIYNNVKVNVLFLLFLLTLIFEILFMN
jgi:hypothetical protein